MSGDIDRIGPDEAQLFSAQRRRERKVRPPCSRDAANEERKIQYNGEDMSRK